MAGVQENPPLDEAVWRGPMILQSMGGLHSDTVLHYFSHSPFFDGTSNNAVLVTQATYNPSMIHLVQTREAFEARLRTMSGLEFVTIDAPSPPDSSVWTIRKQIRRKVAGMDDQVTVLSCYFVVGENVYMSPSLGNVLGSRLLSTVTSLTKQLATAADLPLFTPALGHIYLRPQPKPPVAPSSSQSKVPSKESTPAPESFGRGSSTSAPTWTSPGSDGLREARSLAESLSLAVRYGNEYADTTPMTGEPGSFILSSSRSQPT
ncbi:MAG: hypothetical protein M1823_003689 [Watsoniomyces obsoletus]|nr:MAG: hypothetical protein M1823_003689 [Watsoniomyces obsoletus]